ncbi:hypothetical protein L211DRAFT_882081, partial [Terfezia boudieri ATCC MYA-4762]
LPHKPTFPLSFALNILNPWCLKPVLPNLSPQSPPPSMQVIPPTPHSHSHSSPP